MDIYFLSWRQFCPNLRRILELSEWNKCTTGVLIQELIDRTTPGDPIDSCQFERSFVSYSKLWRSRYSTILRRWHDFDCLYSLIENTACEDKLGLDWNMIRDILNQTIGFDDELSSVVAI
jgi:hypothetical protein